MALIRARPPPLTLWGVQPDKPTPLKHKVAARAQTPRLPVTGTQGQTDNPNSRLESTARKPPQFIKIQAGGLGDRSSAAPRRQAGTPRGSQTPEDTADPSQLSPRP